MNKNIIVFCLLGNFLPAVVLADVNFYGRIHASVDSVSGIAADDSSVSVNSNSSYFGLKGGEELDAGMKAIYQIEADVSANGNGSSLFYGTRDTFVGITGGFGTFKVGKLPAARLYLPDTNLFKDQLGDAANFSGWGEVPSRTDGTLYYAMPDIGGLSAGLTYIPAKSVNASKTTATTTVTTGGNSYALKIGYAIDAFKMNLVYLSFNKDQTNVNGTVQPTSLGVLYDIGKTNLTAQFIRLQNETAAAASSRNIYNVGAKYALSEKLSVKAQYSSAGESNVNVKDDATMIATGVDYSLGKNTAIYAVYATTMNNNGAKFKMNFWGHDLKATSDAQGQVAGEDPSGVGLGLTHNF